MISHLRSFFVGMQEIIKMSSLNACFGRVPGLNKNASLTFPASEATPTLTHPFPME